jgi:hypothetical protein
MKPRGMFEQINTSSDWTIFMGQLQTLESTLNVSIPIRCQKSVGKFLPWLSQPT